MCRSFNVVFIVVFILIPLNLAVGSQTSQQPIYAKGGAVEALLQRFGGSIPFPPQKIVDGLNAQGIDAFGVAIIPHGRSLERFATDYEKPRTMFSFYLGKVRDEGLIEPWKFVYIAYTPGLEELEIIGGTETIPNEFFIVPNYNQSNTNALPVPPKQGTGLCIACHQNGGPIFSNAEWNETSARISVNLHNVPNLDPFAKWTLDNFSRLLNDPEKFDQSVRIGAMENLDFLRPSSLLETRSVFPGREYEIHSGAGGDPLAPRMTRTGKDPYANPSPSWTISLSRDGSQSFPDMPPTKLFQTYCATCHANMESPAPQLPLDDLSFLNAYVGTAGRRAGDLIAKKIMPPITSPMPSPSDRQRMIDALFSGGKLGATKKSLF